MRSRPWEPVLGQILGVLGAGAAPLTLSIGCGGSTTETGRTGGEGGANTGGASAGGPSAGGSLLGGGSGGLILPTAGRNGSGGILSDGGDGKLPTYRVPPSGQSCPPTTFHEVTAPMPDGHLLCAGEAGTAYNFGIACVDRPSDGRSCDQAYDPLCMAWNYNCGLRSLAAFVCGPLPDTNNGCCYVLAGDCPVGRPFFIGGVARTAVVARGRRDWTTERHPDLATLGEEARAALSDAYAREALSEHASVAAFARFTLQCLALGAPSDLVRDAGQAGLDEIEHARLCFGLARAYAGGDVGPGALDVTGALDEPTDLARVARRVAQEGCVAETISALVLAAARDAAQDETVKAVLAEIASQELEHALLAWRFVRWAADTGGAPVRRALSEVFDRAAEHVGFGAVTPLTAPEPELRAHGYLPVEERRSIAVGVLSNVVAPAAAELLRERPGEQSEASGASGPTPPRASC